MVFLCVKSVKVDLGWQNGLAGGWNMNSMVKKAVLDLYIA